MRTCWVFAQTVTYGYAELNIVVVARVDQAHIHLNFCSYALKSNEERGHLYFNDCNNTLTYNGKFNYNIYNCSNKVAKIMKLL